LGLFLLRKLKPSSLLAAPPQKFPDDQNMGRIAKHKIRRIQIRMLLIHRTLIAMLLLILGVVLFAIVLDWSF
jgi:hypothetical protein